MIADYHCYVPNPKERFAAVCCFCLLLSCIGYIFYGTVILALFLPLCYAKMMAVYCRVKGEQRKNRLRRQFRDLLFSLSASFATGRHMEEAMEEAKDNLTEIYGETALAVAELSGMLRKMREAAETDVAVWSDFAKRSGISDIEDFVQVFSAVRETGGDLVFAVNRAAAVIGEKIAIETEIKTMVSQKRLEGNIITAMPAVIVVFLQMASPDYLAVLYQSLGGRILMSMALAATIFAYVMIERMTAIEV